MNRLWDIEAEADIVEAGRRMKHWRRETLRFAQLYAADPIEREAAGREFHRRRLWNATSPQLLRTG
jgi:predicted TIM-barrel fold metal-dependent hydrolase